jgi:DNA-binding response OmpR family regulator
MKILIIEDDSTITETIKLTFLVGCPDAKITTTKFGKEGINLVEKINPEVVILDLGLPDIDGFEVIKNIRLFSKVPILVLTQNDEESAVVRALEMGADEYINKPFRQMELLARSQNIRRRLQGGAKTSERIGPFMFYFANYRVDFNSKAYYLTRTEFRVLHLLALNIGHKVDNKSIAHYIWEADYPGSNKAIRVYISNLRKKLEKDRNNPQLIITKPNGYLLDYNKTE